MDADAKKEGRTLRGWAGPGEWMALSIVVCGFSKGFIEKGRDDKGVGTENSSLLPNKTCYQGVQRSEGRL